MTFASLSRDFITESYQIIIKNSMIKFRRKNIEMKVKNLDEQVASHKEVYLKIEALIQDNSIDLKIQQPFDRYFESRIKPEAYHDKQKESI